MEENKINPKFSEKGFTLLELLVTLTLITCIALLTLPAWHLLQEREARHGSMALLLGSLEQARTAAVQEHGDTWGIFRHHKTSTHDSFRLLQQTEEGSIKPLTPWVNLPEHITFLLTPKTIMSESPPSMLIQALHNLSPEEIFKETDRLGSLQYNTQGVIISPPQGGNELILNFSTSLHDTSGSQKKASFDTIIFSRLTGRAWKKMPLLPCKKNF